jgi:hypothetical protein
MRNGSSPPSISNSACCDKLRPRSSMTRVNFGAAGIAASPRIAVIRSARS